MSFKIYNSLTRQKEEFFPINYPYVGMYVCGPTVYGHSHLGHARSYIIFDILYRYLKFKGFKVKYVQNITDVGHLVGDRDVGEDKIVKQAKLEQIDPYEIAYKYEVSYFEDMDKLNILRPNISCRATGHIIEMIEHIEKLIEKGYAYLTKEGNVYFDVSKFKDYGKLSCRKIEEYQEGERIEIAKDKKNPYDFALWKKASPDHIMQWNSPWGRGYPGWHIECSVMSAKYIGETLDIHGGGLENIFPHHECEIAQSEALTSKPFVKYFIHHNMLTVNGTKMGKSLGNFIILKDLFKKIDPMILRFYILQGHYRSPLDFTDLSIEAAKSGYQRMKGSIFFLKKYLQNREYTNKENIKEEKEYLKSKYNDINKISRNFFEALDDDLNTAIGLSEIFEILKISNNELNSTNPNIEKLVLINYFIEDSFEKILGFKDVLKDNCNKDYNREDRLIELLVKLRSEFKINKNYEFSDKIRDDLKNLGIILKDGKDGTSWTT